VKLKLAVLEDDRPVRITLEIPASLNRDLAAYAAVLSKETGQAAVEPAKLVAPMLQRFIATDRAFTKARRSL
jgi:hypothetical protein